MSGRVVGLTLGALGLLALLLVVVLKPMPTDADETAEDIPTEPAEQTVGSYMAKALAGRPTAPNALPIAQQRRIETEAPDPIEIVLAPETGVGLGWGWNAFHSEAIPTNCVEFKTDKPFSGQTSDLEFTEINDQFELQQAMEMSAEASVKSVAYEVKGEAKFSRNVKITQSAQTYLVEAEVLNAPYMVMPPLDAAARAVTLTPYAQQLAARDPELFKDVCGTGYISATYGGAKLSIVISITSSSRSEREKVSASMEGKGWGGKVSAAMSGSSAEGTDQASRDIHFHQSGGKPTKLPTNPEEIIALAEQLAFQAEAAERIFRVAVTPYEILQNWPREVNLSGSDLEYEELAALWGSYKSIYSDIAAALDNPDLYMVPVQSCQSTKCKVSFRQASSAEAYQTLRHLQDEVLIWLDRLELAARNCLTAEELCETNTALYRSPYAYLSQMPVLACQIISSNTPFEDIKEDQFDCKGGTPATVPSEDIFKAVMIEEPAKGRCALGSLTPGCLSNGAIDAWGARMGRTSVILEDEDELQAMRAQLASNKACDEKSILQGDPETPLTTSLWLPPACLKLASEFKAPETNEDSSSVN